MSDIDQPNRRRLPMQAAAGVALIILGAAAYLWIVFDERLPTTMPEITPGGLTLWAVVRVAAAIALAGGTWLVAVAQINLRRRRSE